MSISNDISVAIVGAGMAGVAAVQRLSEVNIAASLFDRGRAPGGRCSSRRSLPFAFDHGAQYFTARDRVFAQFVEGWAERGWVERWPGRIIALGQPEGPRQVKPIDRWVAVPSMGALPRALARDFSVQSSCTVSRMERNGITWTLFDKEDRPLGSFERVLLAMPPPQALKILPPSSPLVEVIGSHQNAAVLGFDARARKTVRSGLRRCVLRSLSTIVDGAQQQQARPPGCRVLGPAR